MTDTTAELQDRAAEDAAMIHAELQRGLSTVQCPNVTQYTDRTWDALNAWKGPTLAVMDESLPDPRDPRQMLPVRRVRVVDRETGAVRLTRDNVPMTTERLLSLLWEDPAASRGVRWHLWPRTLGH